MGLSCPKRNENQSHDRAPVARHTKKKKATNAPENPLAGSTNSVCVSVITAAATECPVSAYVELALVLLLLGRETRGGTDCSVGLEGEFESGSGFKFGGEGSHRICICWEGGLKGRREEEQADDETKEGARF